MNIGNSVIGNECKLVYDIIDLYLIFNNITKGKSIMKKVTAAIIYKDNKILIAQRKAGDKLEYKWEFPGGKVEPGESPEECLKRELKEELMVNSTIGDFFDSSTYHYKHGSFQLLAYWTSIGDEMPNPTVHEKLTWISPANLDKYDFCPADIPFIDKIKEELV